MAGHAGDTGFGDPETNSPLRHPFKLVQLPRAGGRGRAQDPALRRVVGVSSQTQVTNSNPGSTEELYQKSPPQILNKQSVNSPKPARNCGYREADSPGGGSPSLAGPRLGRRALGLLNDRESRARGEESPPRLSTAPAGARAGVEKAPLRLWR